MKRLIHILSKIFGFKKKKSDANFTHDGLDKIVLNQFYGFGATATGGKGGVVYYVSNEQQLRNAINKPHTRIIYINGFITITSTLSIYENNISILSETEKGTIYGAGTYVYCKNFVFEGVHFAATDLDVSKDHDALAFLQGAENGMVNKCVASFSIDENVDFWGGKNITLQNSVIAHALNNSHHSKGSHSMALLMGNNAKNISVLYNIFAHNVERHIRIGEGATVECIGNIFYDFKAACVLSPNTSSTIINNVYLKGSQTPASNLIDCTSTENVKVYAYGNVNDYGAKEFHNDVLGVLINEPEIYSGAPIPTTESALENWINKVNPKRNYVLQIIEDIKNKTGQVIDSQTEIQL